MKNSNKNRGNTVLAIILIVAISVAGYFALRNRGAEENIEVINGGNLSTEENVAENAIPEGVKMEDGTIVTDEDWTGKQGATTKVGGSFENYAPEKISLAKNGEVVLFFHASWCPYCRAAESDINENVSQIPDGLHILKTDYDKEIALRQKYGVTYQHTFVQVDSSGDLVKKWSGSETLDEIIAKIKE